MNHASPLTLTEYCIHETVQEFCQRDECPHPAFDAYEILISPPTEHSQGKVVSLQQQLHLEWRLVSLQQSSVRGTQPDYRLYHLHLTPCSMILTERNMNPKCCKYYPGERVRVRVERTWWGCEDGTDRDC